VFLWFNKPSMELNFKVKDLSISKSSYPFKQIYDLENGVLVLSDNVKESYIIVDFFDNALKDELMKFNY